MATTQAQPSRTVARSRGSKKYVLVRGRRLRVKRRKLARGTAGVVFKRTRIEIAPDLRGVWKLSTLVHEMIHELDFRLSERTVLKLEEGLVGLVHDNPELFHELAHALLSEDLLKNPAED